MMYAKQRRPHILRYERGSLQEQGATAARLNNTLGCDQVPCSTERR
jgi:hypothetical protein